MTTPPRERTRRLMPLTSIAAALFLVLAVLPSALDVPQSNPSVTLEFAPIPPNDQPPVPPEAANLESLSLGSSSTASGDALGGSGAGLPPPPVPTGTSERPVSKRCIGNPPRQTEDPSSPPCVAFFDGDNGGATHPGVTSDEVVVLWYLDGVIRDGTDSGVEDEQQYGGQYFDLMDPEQGSETAVLRNLRRLQAFFNDRYQTYGRTLHFWAYYSHASLEQGPDPEMRLAEAADNYAHVRPFAVLTSGLWAGFDDVYARYMAERGVLSFGSAAGSRPASFFRSFPGLLWSYPPTIEKRAELYADYVCRRLVPTPVVDGDVGVGGPRTLGMLSTTDPGYQQLAAMADEIRTRVTACGGEIAEEGTFPYAYRVNQPGLTTYASETMARFQQAGVTTVLWAGGYEADHSKAAEQLGYRPEWFVAGDGLHEGPYGGSSQAQSVWEHASILTTITLVVPGAESPCRRALREADPNVGSGDANWGCDGWTFYEDARQLFTGIQVAGPQLTPGAMDRGYRAIPAVPSDDPTVAACFYEAGDYTCVKDATVGHWDPEGRADPANPDGCWRMVEGGRRHLVGGWGDGNLDSRRQVDDICNGYSKGPTLI